MANQQFLDRLYYNYYIKDKENWKSNPELHEYVKSTFNFRFDNQWQRHFEFLRYIMFQFQDCKFIENEEYLTFLNLVLISLLEENAISKEYDINRSELLYDLLSIEKLQPYFFERTFKLSNGRIKNFLEAILNGNVVESICKDIQEALKTATETRREIYSSKKNRERQYTPDYSSKRKNTGKG
jgi:hypothetical protein